MAINASEWCESYTVWWADNAKVGPFLDTEYRMKIMDNGMLLFQVKEGGGLIAVAPHTWSGMKIGRFDPTELIGPRLRRRARAGRSTIQTRTWREMVPSAVRPQ